MINNLSMLGMTLIKVGSGAKSGCVFKSIICFTVFDSHFLRKDTFCRFSRFAQLISQKNRTDKVY